MALIQILDEVHEGVLVLEPRDTYDPAIMGMVETFDGRGVVYNKAKLIQILKDTHEWNDEEAHEWFEYNILGTYMGGHSGDINPCFFTPLEVE